MSEASRGDSRKWFISWTPPDFLKYRSPQQPILILCIFPSSCPWTCQQSKNYHYYAAATLLRNHAAATVIFCRHLHQFLGEPKICCHILRQKLWKAIGWRLAANNVVQWSPTFQWFKLQAKTSSSCWALSSNRIQSRDVSQTIHGRQNSRWSS